MSDSGAGIIEVEALRRQADAVRPGRALLFLNLIFTPGSRTTSTTLSFSGGDNFVVDEFSIRHDADNDLELNGVTVTVGFVRGDSNSDGRVDITDAVRTLRYLFAGVAIACEDAADANDDENVNIADASYVLGYLFQGGPAVPAPFPASGLDPSGDALGCGR